MSYQDQINELKTTVFEAKEQIEKLEKEIKQEGSKEWKPKLHEVYWTPTASNRPGHYEFENDESDKGMIEYGKIFQTQAECQHYCDYRKALKEASNEFSEEEWRNEAVLKWEIYYDYTNRKFKTNDVYRLRDLGAIHFKTEKQAQAFTDQWHDEILKWGV